MGTGADQPNDVDALARHLDDLLARINADELEVDEASADADATGPEAGAATAVAPGSHATAEPSAPEPDPTASEPETTPEGDTADAAEVPTPSEVGDAAIAAAESLTADIDSLSADIEALLNDQNAGPGADAPDARESAAVQRPDAPAPIEQATDGDASDAAEPESSHPALQDSDETIAEDLESILAEAADSALGERSQESDATGEDAPSTASDAGVVTAPDDADQPGDGRLRDVDEASAEVAALLGESQETEAAGLEGEAPVETLGSESADEAPEPSIDQAAAKEPGAPDVEDTSAAATEEIDDELAAVSDALLSQEDDVEPEEAGAAAPASDAGDVAGGGPDQGAAPEREGAGVEEAERAPAPTGRPTAEPTPARGRVRAIVEPIIAKGAPAAATAVLAVSKPLENRPARIRHTVGWMAVYTAFMAACVWVWLIAFRTPVPPENAGGSPVEIAKPEAPTLGPGLERTP